MKRTFGEWANLLWPYLQPKVAGLVGAATIRRSVAPAEGSAPSPHDLNSAHHGGTLADAQAPQFLKLDGSRTLTGNLAVSPGIGIDGVDISAHAVDPDAHHIRATAGDGISAIGALQVVAVDSSVVRTTRNLVAGAGLTGGGTLAADRTFDVGVANTGAAGLSVEADAVRLTSSSAPGAAASVLASDASGFLSLVRLRTPLIDTVSGDLTLNPADDLILEPDSNIVKLSSPVAIGTDNYASQTTGWRADYAGGADFRYLFVDELHAKSFIADLEQALAGAQIICKSVAMLGAAFTAPAAGGTATLTVRDLPSAENMAVFVSGDIVRLRIFSRSAGSLTIADCWGVVTSYADQADKLQTWTFTRSTAPNAGAMGAGTVVAVDAIVLDYGTTGMGFHEVNAIDGAYGANSPYAQIVTWSGHPATGQTVRTRTGNLYGLFSVANEYGLYAGNGVTDASTFVRLSSYTNRLNNLPMEWWNGGSKRLWIDPTDGISIAPGTGNISKVSWMNGSDEYAYLRTYQSGATILADLYTFAPTATTNNTVEFGVHNSAGTLKALIAAAYTYADGKGNISLTGDSVTLTADGSPDGIVQVSPGAVYVTPLVSVPKVRAYDSGGVAITDDADNLGVFVEDGGFVGVGTNNPASPLHLAASTTGYAALLQNSNGAGYGIKIVNGDDTKAALYIENAAETLSRHIIYGDGNAYLSLGGGGVGIGTSSLVSGVKLHVVGEIYSTTKVSVDGPVWLKEISAPSGITNYGALYTKSDNKLYFKDGDGTEHTVAFV